MSLHICSRQRSLLLPGLWFWLRILTYMVPDCSLGLHRGRPRQREAVLHLS